MSTPGHLTSVANDPNPLPASLSIPGDITFGPDVVLRGRNVQATFNRPLLNQGAIIADLVPDFSGDDANTFTFTTAPITNEGLLEARGGGLLTINNLVTNRGTIAARAGSAVSIGGDLPQEAGGTVIVEIAGATTSGFGQITVAGAATFAGTLSIQLASGFVPAAGDRFEVIHYASRTGAFTTVLGEPPERPGTRPRIRDRRPDVGSPIAAPHYA